MIGTMRFHDLLWAVVFYQTRRTSSAARTWACERLAASNRREVSRLEGVFRRIRADR